MKDPSNNIMRLKHTELSKAIWDLKIKNVNYETKC